MLFEELIDFLVEVFCFFVNGMAEIFVQNVLALEFIGQFFCRLAAYDFVFCTADYQHRALDLIQYVIGAAGKTGFCQCDKPLGIFGCLP